MTDHEKVLEFIRLKDQAPFSINPKKTALLVIDVERDFVRPEYAWAQTLEKLVPGSTTAYFERVNARVVPNITRLLAVFRAARLPIMYTGTGTCTGDGRDLPPWLQECDQLSLSLLGKRMWAPPGDPSWEIDDSIAPQPGEIVVNKTSSNALNSTMIDQALRQMGIESVVVCGLTTDVCVGSTARAAADRGFQVVVVEDACTTLSEQMHQSALDVIRLVFGRVRTTDEVVTMLAAETVAART